MTLDPNHIVPFSDLSDAAQLETALAAVSAGNGDRRTLWLLLGDHDGNLVQPIAVDEVPPQPALPNRIRWLRFLTDPLRGSGGASVLIGVGRPGPEVCTDDDRLWRAAAEAVCDAEIRLLGVYLVTAGGIVPITAQ